jgi:hypothetical protein
MHRQISTKSEAICFEMSAEMPALPATVKPTGDDASTHSSMMPPSARAALESADRILKISRSKPC